MYAEDSGDLLAEAHQASKWMWEVDANMAGPMARSRDGKDYFVNEVAMANLDNYSRIGPVMIRQWFVRDKALVARVSLLLLTAENDAYVLDGRCEALTDVPLDAFFLNVLDMESPQLRRRYGLPSSDKVKGK